MKISPKQVAIAILCVIIAFVPTYVAITYYFMRDGAADVNNYSVAILNENQENVSTEGQNQKDLAKMVMNMNNTMYAVNAYIVPEELPDKYYDITVTAGKTVEQYRYYFSTVEGEKTVVYDFAESTYFYIDFENVEDFLSTPSARCFYPASKVPTLSIVGGNDVIPTEIEWAYTTVSGSKAKVDGIETVSTAPIYPMNSVNKLEFDIAPDRCSVRVSQNGSVIAAGDTLDCIPYAKLDSGALSFEIHAEWDSSGEYSGYAKYRFTSTVGATPEFFVNKTSVSSGEFVLIYAKNVTAPDKIGFTSFPSINYDPIFFEEDGMVYALIPFDKELEAPEKYTITLTYGSMQYAFGISVEQRNIVEREYDTSSIDVSRTDAAIAEYMSLLSEIGLKCESTRYFNDKFVDYSLAYTSEISKIVLGYGHKRIPTNGDSAFRLDGVDYFIAAGTNVTAIASGKVVYVGEAELLGKFVVIDHGFGLKTWYCGLSETMITVGSTIVKDDPVGKPGSTGYKATSGVYLITTVMNVPVSPYSLQEDGLAIPK